MHRFDLTRLPRTPWKNGGGVTREIAIIPAGSDIGGFAWRASVADVSSDGPFSLFEGVDRVLVLLEGNGVTLRDADGRLLRRLDEAFVPFAFAGDQRIGSSLIDGPSVDFNVMTRRGVARADVRAIRDASEIPGSESGVLFAARGTWNLRTRHGDELTLDEGTGCWWDGKRMSCRVTPSSPAAVLLAARIESGIA